MYQSFKQKLIKPYINLKSDLIRFNLRMNYKAEITSALNSNGIHTLTQLQKKKAVSFYKSKGIRLRNTLWHQFYTGMTGDFYENYIPEDIFHPCISPKLNQNLQWPALLDKNLSYSLFREFSQPVVVIKNINGFFYEQEELISQNAAIKILNDTPCKFIIKPSIESGAGKNIKTFSVADGFAHGKESISLDKMFKIYKKDFLIQKFVNQSEILSSLNPTSLNTIRTMSYLREDGVYLLSSIIRIGAKGSSMDNYSQGGIVCGIKETGMLKSLGYKKTGEIVRAAPSGISLEGFSIPNYNLVEKMVKQLHLKIPYFKIASWDIGIDENNLPVYIECNTYRQGIGIHQITNGPLLGKFEDEILSLISTA